VIVFDAGALVALDRNDRAVWVRLREAAQAGMVVLVPLGAFAQAWRGGSRQARLAQAMEHVEQVSFDQLAREAGELCGRASTSDVVDASVALVAARPGVTHVYTSDSADIEALLRALRVKRQIIRC